MDCSRRNIARFTKKKTDMDFTSVHFTTQHWPLDRLLCTRDQQKSVVKNPPPSTLPHHTAPPPTHARSLTNACSHLLFRISLGPPPELSPPPPPRTHRKQLSGRAVSSSYLNQTLQGCRMLPPQTPPPPRRWSSVAPWACAPPFGVVLSLAVRSRPALANKSSMKTLSMR